jgi:RNA polymerase sigma-70 factor (ECF subfamily)
MTSLDAELLAILLKLPAWAAGLPLGGKVYSGLHCLALPQEAAEPLVAPDPDVLELERDDTEASTAALSLAEGRAIIQELSDADQMRLKKIARIIAGLMLRRTPYDHDDLRQEAFDRVLSGRRVWPRGAPVGKFLAGVMKSIASEWKKKSKPHELVGDPADPRCGVSQVMALIDMKKIVAKFDDDPEAQKILFLLMQEVRGEELQWSSGLGKVEYESKRKKIRRRIEKLLADE